MNRSTKNLRVGALALAIMVVSTTIGSASTIYSAAGDFSATNNPNGVWSYGDEGTASGNPDPTTFAGLLTPRTGLSFGAIYTGLQAWTNSPSSTDPNVIKNPTAGVISDGNNVWQPGELTLGPFGGPTVVRFTAPSAGLYMVSAQFSPSEVANSAPNGYVYEGNTQLFEMSAATAVTYNTLVPLNLAANQTIDFIAYGPGDFKTTGLDATITLVPEPASLVLCGLGAVGLLFAVRSRRKS